MKLEQFLGLTTTQDGRPVVTLLADPSMKDAGGAPVGFLSLVPHGANGRYFTASKADLNLGEGGTPAPLSPDNGQPWWRTMFAAMFGGVQVTKSPGDPVDFDQAMTVERLRRARWEATDALWEVIANIMESPDVADKPAAVATALQRFASHVNGLVTASLAMKAEDRAAIAREIAAPHGLASKAGRAISAANLAKITGATTALTAALAALQELEKLGEVQPTYKAETTEDPMPLTPEQILDLAKKGAAEAIMVAKSAGVTDPAQLAKVGTDTFTSIVTKVAPSGPAQPAMPQDALARQMAQSMGMGSSMGEPMDQLMAAIKLIPGLVAKVDTALTQIDGLNKAINGHGEGATREPGVLEVAAKSAELSAAVAERVAKIAPITQPPRGSSDPEAQRGRIVSKSGQADPGDDVFNDSPLGGFMGRGKQAPG